VVAERDSDTGLHRYGAIGYTPFVKYLTTLEVAHELKISKQTLLNWLYAGKVPEPPRNRQGYRLWSPSRVALVRRLILEGRLHKRTVVHKEPTGRREDVAELAREVGQFLRDGKVDLDDFLRELVRVTPEIGRRLLMRARKK
jgi:DNA-binding transcriptional MerR regulator